MSPTSLIPRTPRMTLLLILALACAACQTQPLNRKAAYHMQQAQLYMEEGLKDSALASFALALEADPHLTAAHLGMGHIYREEGKLDLATRAYEAAYKEEPDSARTNYYLGLVRQLSGNMRSALEHYLRAVAIDPSDQPALEHLATTYMQLGRPADALPYAQRATQSMSASATTWANLGACYMLLGKYEDAVGAFDYAIGRGDQRPEIQISLAEALLKIGHFPQAMQILQPLARTKPSAAVYEHLGYTQFRLGQYDDALASYRAALSYDPHDPASLNGLGVCLMTLYIEGGRNDATLRNQATQAWRQSLKLNPAQPQIIDLMNRYQNL